jgi:hypothetical protein
MATYQPTYDACPVLKLKTERSHIFWFSHKCDERKDNYSYAETTARENNRVFGNMFVRSLLLVVLLVVSVSHAFTIVTPNHQPYHGRQVTSSTLSMKFLKDLGFEKPSWLPDFGGATKGDGDSAAAKEDVVVNADQKETSEGEPVTAASEE